MGVQECSARKRKREGSLASRVGELSLQSGLKTLVISLDAPAVQNPRRAPDAPRARCDLEPVVFIAPRMLSKRLRARRATTRGIRSTRTSGGLSTARKLAASPVRRSRSSSDLVVRKIQTLSGRWVPKCYPNDLTNLKRSAKGLRTSRH